MALSYRECWNCGRELEDRGYPTAGKFQFMWVPVWVHSWGGKVCYPQLGAVSPMADPAPCTHNAPDARTELSDGSFYCFDCGDDID